MAVDLVAFFSFYCFFYSTIIIEMRSIDGGGAVGSRVGAKKKWLLFFWFLLLFDLCVGSTPFSCVVHLSETGHVPGTKKKGVVDFA